MDAADPTPCRRTIAGRRKAQLSAFKASIAVQCEEFQKTLDDLESEDEEPGLAAVGWAIDNPTLLAPRAKEGNQKLSDAEFAARDLEAAVVQPTKWAGPKVEAVASYCSDDDADEEKAINPPACPMKMVVFTANLLVGLFVGQMVSTFANDDFVLVWSDVIRMITMACLAFIMINVGYEFDIDKSKLQFYVKEYFIAMTAAGFPWLFVALYFMFVPGIHLPWKEALLAARFAAPTSAGILFSMLEASGMKSTWLFEKARLLAIFDDLDTILLMIPLKAMMTSMKWELSVEAIMCVLFLAIGWRWLHALSIPCTWYHTMAYAVLVTACCEGLYEVTGSHIEWMDGIHLEVLLPAFTIGCVARSAHTSHMGTGLEVHRAELKKLPGIVAEKASMIEEETVAGIVSAVFMALVGLSMPPLFKEPSSGGHRRLSYDMGDEGDDTAIAAGTMIAHVLAVSFLMVLGKMFPLCCYSDEAGWRTRLALSLGMCPRGEVGAGVIVISIAMGVKGPAVTIAVLALTINLVLSSGFIMAVTKLARSDPFAPKTKKHQAEDDDNPTPYTTPGQADHRIWEAVLAELLEITNGDALSAQRAVIAHYWSGCNADRCRRVVLSFMISKAFQSEHQKLECILDAKEEDAYIKRDTSSHSLKRDRQEIGGLKREVSRVSELTVASDPGIVEILRQGSLIPPKGPL